jgi:simple sugar transport system ATP-binding protein
MSSLVSTSNGFPALRLAGIDKIYGPTQVLNGFNLSIGRGEVVALMGANGAGKSTLAKIASGVVQPDQGRIFVGGREVNLSSPRAAREAGIVIVHQSTDQLGVPGLSVAENLVLDGLCTGGIGALVRKAQIQKRAQAVAAGIRLDIPLDRDFGELGPAHRQLVAIARAVAADASILIFDEPTATLASSEAVRLFGVIEQLRARGVGVLYISHRLADISRTADRIIVMRNGRLVAEQVQPFDLAVAVRAMIGRDLAQIGSRRVVASGGRSILDLHRVRLTSAAEPFDLSIHAGQIVAITGALGSGKSRLLRALFGLSRFVDGRVDLDGLPWRPREPAEAIGRGVFMAGEDRWRSSFLPPSTPGADIAGTVALPHRRRWFRFGLVQERREHAVARQVIDTLHVRCRGIGDTLDLLSGGNQQKVVLGRWQAGPCRLLLLDEPFQGIDVGARRDLITAIRAGAWDAATLLTTSDVEEALEVADTVAVMRNHSVVCLPALDTDDPSAFLAAIGAVEASEAGEKGDLAA